MTIYDQLVAILGTPPNEMIMYLYFLICAFLIVSVVKMIFVLFKIIFNIKM